MQHHASRRAAERYPQEKKMVGTFAEGEKILNFLRVMQCA
jgi:hypothetical protein